MSLEKLSSFEIEKHCLAGLIKNPNILSQIDQFVNENSFFCGENDEHKVIFSIVRQLILDKKSFDNVLIAQKIIDLNVRFEGVSPLDYLEAITQFEIEPKACVENFKELAKLKYLRDEYLQADKVQKSILLDKGKPTNEIISKIDQLKNTVTAQIFQNKDEFTNVFGDIEEYVEGIASDPPKEEDLYFGPFKSVNELYGPIHQPGNITMIAARSGAGKAQNVNCKVITPDGWKKIGEIRIGDYVAGSDGDFKKVLGVFPQGIKKSFKVTMSDGGTTYCCDEHLWFTETYKNRTNRTNKDGSVKNLKEISETLIDNHMGLNHGIKYVKPICFEAKDLPLDPYLVGCLLGDGGLTGQSVIFTTKDQEILEIFKTKLPKEDKIKLRGGHSKKDFSITRKKREPHNPSETKKILASLGLMGKGSKDKFIPNEYKFGSVRQRKELLRGLLDTDGYIKNQTTTAQYCSISSRLAQDVQELALGLGGRATISKKKAFYYDKNNRKKKCNDAYIVSISFTNEIIPFKSKRKAGKFKRKTRRLYRYIKSVERVDDAESVCIMIDSQDHLYVTDDFILTHNTSLSSFYNIYMAQKYRIPCLHIDNAEMSVRELQARAVCMMTKGQVPLGSILRGTWRENPQWTHLVREAWPKVKDIQYDYFQCGDLDAMGVINGIRRFSYNVVGRGKPFFVNFDYVKPFNESERNSPEWKMMGHFMNDVKKFIQNEINVPFWCSIQTNRSGITNNKRAHDLDESENVVSISDRITHYVSFLFLMRKKVMDEIADEQNKYGNVILRNIGKERQMTGSRYYDAINPVEYEKGRYKQNYINLSHDSFYFKDCGDFKAMVEDMKDDFDLEDGEKDGEGDKLI